MVAIAIAALGRVNGVVLINTHSLSTFDISAPYDAYVGVRVTIGGLLRISQSTAGANWATLPTEWILPRAAAAYKTYHVKYAYTGNALSGAATGSWIEITGTHSWFFQKSIGGSWSGSGTLSISDDAGATTLSSATISLSVENV